MGLRGEHMGDLRVLIHLPLIIKQRLTAADKLDAYAFLVVDHAETFHHADLAGPHHMCPAAGADIRSRNCDDSDFSGQLLLAPVIQRLQFLSLRKAFFYRNIAADHCICVTLHLHQFFPGHDSADINGDAFLTHMESDILVSETSVNQTR